MSGDVMGFGDWKKSLEEILEKPPKSKKERLQERLTKEDYKQANVKRRN